jgi:hypothetical protein
MMRFFIIFLFSKNSRATNCANLDVEYPKGIENPASGETLYLSNLAYTSEFIYSGGQFDSEDVYQGGVSL